MTGVIKQFEIIELTASDYFTLSQGFNPNSFSVWRIAPKLARVHIDCTHSVAKGETTIGATTNKVRNYAYFAGRVSTSDGPLPATGIAIGGGRAVRVHAPAAGTAFVINGIFETV